MAETENAIFMAETKARADMQSAEVLAKAEAASTWCKQATDYAVQHGGKPWKYLLIAHDEVNEAKRLEDFSRFEKKAV